jgi:hypothetical protein
MYRFTWSRWLRTLDGRRRSRPITSSRRLALTNLESRDVPAAFTPGDLVVYRVGDGTATVNTAAAVAVFLDEYSPTGTLVQSIPMPTTTVGANHRLTEGGSTFGDGLLTDSADGRYLIVPGYDAAVGTAAVASTTPATVNRVVGRVDINGNVDTTTALTDATAAVRSATSADGFGIWTAGTSAAGNLRFTTFGTTGTSIGASQTFSSQNGVGIANGQLYISAGATGIDGLASVGTGLPTTSNTTETLLTGFPTTGSPFPAPRQFVFQNASTVYVADSRTTATNNQGGLQKWTFDGSSWNLQYTVNIGPSEGLIGLVGDFSGANPVLYGITAETAVTVPSKLVKIVDNGPGPASTVTPLATVGTNMYFRGLAFSPTPVGTGADTVAVGTDGSPVTVGSTVTFTATVSAATNPTGYITFQDTSTTPATTLGVVPLIGAGTSTQAQFVTNSLTVGTHTIKAIYGGDGTHAGGNNTVSQVITGTTTSMAVTSDTALPTSANQTVTFTATITPNSGSTAPTGTVNFFDNGLLINSSPITVTASGSNGVATVTETTSPIQAAGVNPNPLKMTPGSHTITAVYTPTGTFVGSTNTKVQSVKVNPFGAGDLLVYRAGDGSSALTVNGNTVYIDEFTTAGGQTTPVQSISMPTSSIAGGNQALITSSQQSVEGQISLSGDGQYVFLTGYDTPPGGPTDIHISAAAAIPRTIGRIKFDGTIDTSMTVTDLADGGSVRGVVSPDGNQVYATGSTGGVRYISHYAAGSTTSTQLDDGTSANLNTLGIAGGQLYVAGGTTGTVKVSAVGTGLPTTSGQTLSILNGLPTGTANSPGFPESFFFTKLQNGPTVGPDTVYIADNGNFANGTITKWSLVTGTWTKVDTITSGAGSDNPSLPSYDNVTGTVTGGTATLYVAYGNGGNGITGPGFLDSISDTGGYNAAIPVHTATALFSAPSNETFRGVAVVPTQALSVAAVQVNDGSAQHSEVRSIAVTFSGPVTFSGSGTVNQNAAAAFQLSQINDLATHFASPVAVNNLAAAVTTNGSGQTVVTLSFTTTGNPTTIDPVSALNGGAASLADGRFQLTILSANVSGASGNLVGGGPNGNYVSPTDTLGGGAGQLHLYRIFGDVTGDGIVDQQDLGQFRTSFNSAPANPAFDANNDGNVDQQDLGQFRTRFNGNVFV